MNAAEPVRRGVVKPRDAASLILFRRTKQGEVEILMGRRHVKHKFVPEFFVFPGGRLDAEDAHAVAASELTGDVADLLHRSSSPRRGFALAMAAVRETFEEAGLLLGAPAPTKAVNAKHHPKAWSDVYDTGLAPDLARLDFIARAITPAESPIRFHARFFIAEGERLHGRLGGSGELEDLAWRPMSECLKLPLVDITEYLLGEFLPEYFSAPPARGADRTIELFHFRKGVPHVSRS